MSSKSILIISSYTVSKLVRFFETHCSTVTPRSISNVSDALSTRQFVGKSSPHVTSYRAQLSLLPTMGRQNAHQISFRAQYTKGLSTLSQKSATVAENGDTTATVAEFADSRTFLRQCGQAFTIGNK